MGEEWVERICASKEPKRSFRSKSESQARSDRGINAFNEGGPAALPRAFPG